MKLFRWLIVIFAILLFLPLGAVNQMGMAERYKQYGDYYVREGNIEAAILQYKIALIYNKDYPGVHKALGGVYYRSQDYRRAYDAFSRAYELEGREGDLKNLVEHVERLLPENEPERFKVARVVIEKSSFVLKLYDDKGIVRKIYHVAIGKNPDGNDKQRIGDKRTPEGEFIITHRNYFKQGSRQRKIYGPYYFGLQSNKWGGFGIHGTYQSKSVGNKASLGCIRLYAEDVVELREYIGVGTKVMIVN